MQQRGIRGATDPVVLEWAASEGRVLLTHDVTTMGTAAYERIAAGMAMPGVFFVGWRYPTGRAIDALELLVGASIDGEWENQVRYLPPLS